MSPVSLPRCYVCTGKDCRREDGHRELLDAMRKVGDVQRVKCQDLCEGPVAGVVLADRVEWFVKLRKPRHRTAIAALVAHPRHKVPSELKDRWAKKRGGKIER